MCYCQINWNNHIQKFSLDVSVTETYMEGHIYISDQFKNRYMLPLEL
jgi:hypothetical protein